MTVAQTARSAIENAEGGGGPDRERAGLSRIDALDFIDDQGPGAPAEVILLPSMDE